MPTDRALTDQESRAQNYLREKARELGFEIDANPQLVEFSILAAALVAEAARGAAAVDTYLADRKEAERLSSIVTLEARLARLKAGRV